MRTIKDIFPLIESETKEESIPSKEVVPAAAAVVAARKNPGYDELTPFQPDAGTLRMINQLLEIEEEDLPNNVIDLASLKGSWSMYSPQQKLATAIAYSITGSNAEAASLVPGVTAATVTSWKNRAPWWQDAMAYARRIQAEEFDGITTGLMKNLLVSMQDRIQQGDEVLDKNGRARRKKISARDASTIYAILFDKRALARGDPTSRSANASNEETLKRLEDRFRNFAKSFEEKQINVINHDGLGE